MLAAEMMVVVAPGPKPGAEPGAKSLSVPFFFTSISLSKKPTMRFYASNVDMFSKTSSKGFCLWIIFLMIGSNFCLKLALLI